MEGYGDFCPLSRAAEIYATRWTPLIIRNLQFGCSTFTEIRDGLPGISRTVLTQRLRMLEHHGLVDARRRRQYRLTDAGEGLEAVTDVLGRWGERYLEMRARALRRRRRAVELLQARRARRAARASASCSASTSATTSATGCCCSGPPPEICFKPPGYDEDLVLVTTSEWLTKWYIGKVSLGDALHAGVMELQAPLHLERMLAANGRPRDA